MENPTSSFIPHDTAQMAVPTGGPGRSAGLADVAFMLALVLCAASLSVAGGIFLYGQYLATLGASKLEQLDRAKAALDPSLIEQLSRLEDRMRSADTLLGRHLAPGIFFDMLGQTTLATVSFTALDMDASDARHVALKMTGVAQGVNSIALQAEVFGKNGVIASPIFSGISRQQDGVHFSVAASVNPSAIAWGRVVSGAPIPTEQAAPESQQPQSAPAALQESPFDGPSGSDPVPSTGVNRQ